MAALAYVHLQQVALRAQVEPEAARRLFQALEAFLAEGNAVRINDFGNFYPVFYEQRMVSSPVVPSGQVLRPARTALRFNMNKKLRRRWTLPLRTEGEGSGV